ncbi:MAG: hypothetical protein JO222_14130, partial [Frankiales bacterium]|nr:hypothetical protein [Frankiales bacterium]
APAAELHRGRQQLFLALVIGMFVWRRRRAAAGGLTRMAWVLAFPLGLMLLLVLFSQSAKLLPATM